MLTVKARAIIEEMDELMEIYFKKFATPSMFDCMSMEDIDILKRAMALLTDSKDYMMEQAQMLDAIDKKLDMLLAK